MRNAQETQADERKSDLERQSGPGVYGEDRDTLNYPGQPACQTGRSADPDQPCAAAGPEGCHVSHALKNALTWPWCE